MKEQRGNIWQSGADIICITTNCIFDSNTRLVMGAGIAKQAAIRYPQIKKIFADNIIQNGHHVCLYEVSKGKFIASFPTKYNWRDPSDLNLILQSVKEIAEIAGNNDTIAMTRPGCSLGQLDWGSCVKPAIMNELDNRFTIYTKW